MNLLSLGTRIVSAGLRRGNSGLAGMGAAVLVVKAIQRMAGPKRERIYTRTLKPGDTLRIRALGPDDDIEVVEAG